MKIALVSPYDLSLAGGVQSQVTELVRGLRARGEEAFAVGPGTPSDLGIDVGGSIRVPVNGSRAPICLEPGAVRRARAAVAGAEVVHLHEPLVPVIGPSLLGLSRPLVLTFHAAAPRWVTAAYRLTPRRWWRDRVFTKVSTVAAASLPCPARIIPNGVDVVSYQVATERDPMQVAFLGRDDPRKGLEVLLRAWPGVRARVPQAKLVVMGRSGRGNLGGEGIELTGAVSEDEKRARLSQAAVLAAPNLGGESFGITVVEGMAAGCAVVASDLPAFREVTGGAARLVPPGKAASLAEGLVEMLTDPHLGAALGAKGQARAAQFDWSVVIPQYLDCYRSGAFAGSG